LVSFNYVASVSSKHNIKKYKIIKKYYKIPFILKYVKKYGREHFKRRAPGNVTALIVQRASIELRQLLLIISSPRK